MRQKIFLERDRICDIWEDSINGLLDIARRQVKQGEMEEARRITSNVAKILDEAYEGLKRHWEICSSIAPTFVLFAWRK